MIGFFFQGTVVSETVTEKKSIRADDPTGGFELFDLDTLSQELKEKAKIKRDAEAEKPEADEAEEEEEEAADDGDKEEDDEDDSGNWSKLELESLKRHNELRRKHGAPPMKLSREVIPLLFCTYQTWQTLRKSLNAFSALQLCPELGESAGERGQDVPQLELWLRGEHLPGVREPAFDGAHIVTIHLD